MVPPVRLYPFAREGARSGGQRSGARDRGVVGRESSVVSLESQGLRTEVHESRITSHESRSLTPTRNLARSIAAGQTGYSEGPEIVVDRNRAADGQALDEREARAIGKAEAFVPIARENLPRPRFICRRQPKNRPEAARQKRGAKGARRAIVQPVTQQRDGFVKHEIAGCQPAVIFRETGRHRPMIGVLGVDERVPRAGIDEYAFHLPGLPYRNRLCSRPIGSPLPAAIPATAASGSRLRPPFAA